MIKMYHVDNIFSSVNLYPTDVDYSQENASSVDGLMNESFSLHHTQNIPSHSARQIKSNPKSKRDIARTIISFNLYTYQNYL